MRCGRCRAQVTLGSAQCERCGASLLEGLNEPEAPRRFGDAPENVAMAPPVPFDLSGLTAPPRPPDAPPGGAVPPPPAPQPTRGHPGPPPPRPGQQPQPARRQQTASPKRRTSSSGCGCAVPILLFAVVPALFGVGRAAVEAIREGTDVFGGGETVELGTLQIGRPATGSLDDDDTHRWRLEGEGGRFFVSVDGEDGIDTEVRVAELDGDELGENDDFSGLDAGLEVSLAAGTTYVVDVTEHNDRGGDYEVRVDPLVLAAGPLLVGQPVGGAVVRNQTATYEYVGEGREAVFAVAGDPGFDATLRIRDAAGTELASNDDTNGVDPEVRLFVDAGAVVTVEVAGLSLRPGTYTVEVR